MWLEHKDFLSFVKDCWCSISAHGCPLTVLQHKLRVLRKALRSWNWEVFGDVHHRVKLDLDALAEIQNDIVASGGSDEKFAKETELQANLNDSLRLQEILWKEKARLRWLSDGDRNTQYFHAMCRARRHRSSITLLQNNDEVIDDPLLIQSHIIDYYADLFAHHTDYLDNGLVSSIIPSLVTEAENSTLILIPSDEEIWTAVKSMDIDSAPGPDGFNGHFYISCWEIVGADVIAAVQYFFYHGQLSASFNSGLIILIPKVEHADSITQFRPIALTNFVFKIIPKILALRLSSIASRIISPQQHAFVAGRNISDCILMTSECFNLLESKCHGGNVAIKVDITKAFDTLSWEFLLHVLQAFGFHSTFVLWVRALLLSAKLSLSINGRPVGYFSCGRGVRQGDPLSPLLFCLAEEVLSRGLSMLASSGQLRLITSPRGTTAPSHVLFADDIIVFCRGDKRNLERVLNFFEKYGEISGQIINKQKSQVFLGSHLNNRRHSIASVLGIPLGSAPFNYLGVPIFHGKPRAAYFQPIVDRIRLRLSSWMSSLLSMAGRLQLIKSVISGMFVYSFQVYEWPVSLLRRIEPWCRNFLWSGSINKRGIPLVAWKSCCAPISEGGLGLKQLVLLNRSLLLKSCWEIFSSNSEGCTFIRTRFSNRRSYAPSSIWPGVRKFWSVVQNNGLWLIGSGEKVMFWRDNFIGKPIINLFSNNATFMGNLTETVATFIEDGSWNFPPLLQLHYPALCHLIAQVPISSYPTVEDKLIWSPSSSGELTAKLAFQFLNHPSPILDWGKSLWSNFILPRMSMLAWKVMRGRVISDDFLQRRGVSLASRCDLCGSSSETLIHIFLLCSFTAKVWARFISLFELGTLPPSILNVFQLGLMGRSLQLKELWLLCFTTIIWFIWHTRNKIRFDGRSFTVDTVCGLISGHIYSASRLASGTMHNSTFDLCILKNFGVQGRPHRAPRVIEVNWQPPLFGWVKINSDGTWKHDAGVGGYGAVFRDHRGYFLGAFASSLDIPSSVAAEVMAVIKAIELAWVRDWKHIWIEVDSSIVLHYLLFPSLVPWNLRVRWMNCIHTISQMSFRSSHIFREGNRVADALANFGSSSSSSRFVWWDSPPSFIVSLCNEDLSLSQYRFC
ncbi:hypothetical protein M0R45_019074 [Rubus argutus]